MVATKGSAHVSKRGTANKQRVNVDPLAFRLIKQNSKLLTIANEVKVELQNAESEQIRSYLFAIYFRKLLAAAQSEFELEESVGYVEGARFDSPESERAAQLRLQHATLLSLITEMLELADAGIERTSLKAESLGLLNRFWSFQQKLQWHEDAELSLIERAAKTT